MCTNLWSTWSVFFFFSLHLVFFFITPWPLKQQAQSKKKKKTQLSREDHVNSKVGFLKFCYLLFLANNYETVILNIKTIFCKTMLLPLLVELKLELEIVSPFGVETETTIEIWSSICCEFWRYIALVHWLPLFKWYAFFFSFSFLLLVYII